MRLAAAALAALALAGTAAASEQRPTAAELDAGIERALAPT